MNNTVRNATVLILLFLSLTFTIVLGGGLVFSEAVLPDSNGGLIQEVNNSDSGHLYLSDYDKNYVWDLTGSLTETLYTRYTIPFSPIDAKPDSSGQIWWTDGSDQFGYINAGGTAVTSWQIPGSISHYLAGLDLDPTGTLWMTSYLGVGSNVYSFTETTQALCSFSPLTLGADSYNIIYDDGNLWLVNNSSDKVLKIDLVSTSGTAWELPASSNVKGISLDANGALWMADTGLDAIQRLEPSTDELTTYSLPFNQEPQMVFADIGGVYYTEGISGTLGVINPPVVASGVITSAPKTSFAVTSTCIDLDAGIVSSVVATTTGTLTWSENTAPLLPSASGWTIYELPLDASPYGVVLHEGELWVTDPGRQMVLRASFPDDYLVFLPIILK